MANEFGDLLRALRVAVHVSLGELSRFLEVSVTYLSDVERGTRPPLTVERIEKAALLLELSPQRTLQLLEVAARTRGVFELTASNLSPTGSQVGATLMRGWPRYSEEELQKLAIFLEGLEEET